MKKTIAILAVCCLLLAALPALGEEPAAEPFLFRGAISFGMTPDEVREKAESVSIKWYSTETVGNIRFYNFLEPSSNSSAVFFCFLKDEEDTTGLIEIYYFVYDLQQVARASENDSSAKIDYDAAVLRQDYDWLEQALTEKYGEPESAAESLSFMLETSRAVNGVDITPEQITRRTLAQAGGAMVIEHFTLGDDDLTVNVISYYAPNARNLFRNPEDEFHSFLLNIL